MATQIDGTAPTVPAELPPDETLCVKCGMAEPEGLGNVCKSSGVQCKLCTSVYQLLYRHLGSMPAALQSLSATQQKNSLSRVAPCSSLLLRTVDGPL